MIYQVEPEPSYTAGERINLIDDPLPARCIPEWIDRQILVIKTQYRPHILMALFQIRPATVWRTGVEPTCNL